MIIFINKKSTKFCQITLHIKRFIHKRKVDILSASRFSCIVKVWWIDNNQIKTSLLLSLPVKKN